MTETSKLNRDNALSSSSSSDDSSDDSEDELSFQASASGKPDEDSEDSVHVEFIFSDPKEAHFHSIKHYLKDLVSLPSYPASELTELILNQVAVGSIVCVEDQSDAYAFITALNVQEYTQHKCIQNLMTVLLGQCPPDYITNFQAKLESTSCAFLLNERMINLPYQLIPPLHKALLDDIAWAVSNDPKPAQFELEHFVLISRRSLVRSSGKSKSKKSKKTKVEEEEDHVVVYQNFEDEFLEAEADYSFSFPMAEKSTDLPKARETKEWVIMVIQKQTYVRVVESLSSLIIS